MIIGLLIVYGIFLLFIVSVAIGGINEHSHRSWSRWKKFLFVLAALFYPITLIILILFGSIIFIVSVIKWVFAKPQH
jgi:hypothetical protein